VADKRPIRGHWRSAKGAHLGTFLVTDFPSPRVERILTRDAKGAPGNGGAAGHCIPQTAVTHCPVRQGAVVHQPIRLQGLGNPVHAVLGELLLRGFVLHLARHADGQR
jgi:hypothetical protein